MSCCMITKFILSAFMFVLSAAASPEIDCIAHRGLSSVHQENTIEAIKGAWGAGANIVEVDVWMLKDGILVLFHDDSIRRKRIQTLTYAALQRLTPDYHVPTLAEAAAACTNKECLLLDLKDTSPQCIDRVITFAQGLPEDGPKLMFQSHKMDVLKNLQKSLDSPTLLFVTSLKKVGPLKKTPDPKRMATLLAANGMDGISAKGRKFVDKKFIRAFQDQGLTFYVWTINPADRIQHYTAFGVDGIITDYPQRMASSAKTTEP